MFTKDLERLVRSMVRQRTDPEYIRYYLIETYQLTPAAVNEVFTALGVGKVKEKFNTKVSTQGDKPAVRRPFS
jgi:hypothetical protein